MRGLILALSLCCFASAEPAGLERVTLQLKWRHQFQFAGYYAAQAKGFYREAGLDVRFVEAAPGEDPAEPVLSGRAEFGVGTSELLLLRAQGKPVVVLAAIYQHSPLALLARRTPSVDDLQALHDKPIMIEPLSAELFAYFRNEGIDPSTLSIQPHTFESADLIEGRVAAMSAYSTDEPFVLNEAGVDHLLFTPRAGGIDFYGDNLFTTEEQVRRQPGRVERFRKASIRGWEYALSHPAEIVDLILADYGAKKTREHLLFEAERTRQLMHPDLIEVGHMNPGRWRHIADTYAEFDMLPRGFELAGFLYEPDPRPDLRWVGWTLVGATVLFVGALGWALPLSRLNRQLRAAKDAAEAAGAAKSRYLAFLAHEIRTPLNGIVGVVELMKGGALDKEQRANIELLDMSAMNLLHMVDNVLDHSRLDAGRMTSERLPLALGEFVDNLVALYRPSALAKGIELTCVIAPGVPDGIVTDPVRLRQILANLLSNAVKFTLRGSIRLEVEVVGAAPDRRLRFSVTDTGQGIPADMQARIFDPFIQAEASTARRYGGSGLGLSISRQLARLLGGDIQVESTVGKGSAFTVDIACEAADVGLSAAAR